MISFAGLDLGGWKDWMGVASFCRARPLRRHSAEVPQIYDGDNIQQASRFLAISGAHFGLHSGEV